MGKGVAGGVKIILPLCPYLYKQKYNALPDVSQLCGPSCFKQKHKGCHCSKWDKNPQIIEQCVFWWVCNEKSLKGRCVVSEECPDSCQDKHPLLDLYAPSPPKPLYILIEVGGLKLNRKNGTITILREHNKTMAKFGESIDHEQRLDSNLKSGNSRPLEYWKQNITGVKEADVKKALAPFKIITYLEHPNRQEWYAIPDELRVIIDRLEDNCEATDEFKEYIKRRLHKKKVTK